jgi:hypothetical protein
LVGGLILAVVWRNTRPAPVIVGMLVSLGVMTAIEVLPALSVTRPFWMAHVGTEIFWPWYTLIGAAVTLSVAWALRSSLSAYPKTSTRLPA